MYDVLLHDLPLEDCIEPTAVRNLFVRPGHPRPGRRRDRAGARLQPGAAPAAGARATSSDDYDFVAHRLPARRSACSPSTAWPRPTEVVVPIQCEYYALEGLGQLLRNVNLVQTQPQPRRWR